MFKYPLHTDMLRFGSKSLALLAGILFVSLLHAQPAPKAKDRYTVADNIVAIVNNQVITRIELEERLNQVETRLKKQGVKLPPRAELQKQILEHMILESAQVQQAKESGIQVDDRQLDRALATMAETNKLSQEAFRKQIENSGLNYNRYRENIRADIMMHRLREREVINKVQISEAEIDNALRESRLYQAPEEVHLAQIMIRVPENASAEQIAEKRARAEMVLQNLRAGANFQESAAKFSDTNDGLRGGDMGWRTLDSLPALFVNNVLNLKPGEVSEIMKSPNGFHILKVINRKRLSTPKDLPKNSIHAPVQQIHARHILIKVDHLTSVDEAKRKLTELRQRLVNNADTFENLARSFSNDNSASRGGDLGWIYPGDTVPEFEKAMVALQTGQISEPVETQFGVHLIQVIDRKTDDISNERKRIAIRNAIRERKIEEATEEWLRQVRDGAYVEYRLEQKQ